MRKTFLCFIDYRHLLNKVQVYIILWASALSSWLDVLAASFVVDCCVLLLLIVLYCCFQFDIVIVIGLYNKVKPCGEALIWFARHCNLCADIGIQVGGTGPEVTLELRNAASFGL